MGSNRCRPPRPPRTACHPIPSWSRRNPIIQRLPNRIRLRHRPPVPRRRSLRPVVGMPRSNVPPLTPRFAPSPRTCGNTYRQRTSRQPSPLPCCSISSSTLPPSTPERTRVHKSHANRINKAHRAGSSMSHTRYTPKTAGNGPVISGHLPQKIDPAQRHSKRGSWHLSLLGRIGSAERHSPGIKYRHNKGHPSINPTT